VTGKVNNGTQKISGDFPSIFLPALPISEGPVDASSTPTKLGANLYLKERKKDITSTPNATVAIQSTNKEKEKRNISNTVDDDDTDGGKQDEKNSSSSGINGSINSPSTTSSYRRDKDESESKLSPVTSEMTLASLATRRSEESVAGVNLLASLLGSSSSSINASNDLTDIEIVDLFGENGGGILASEVTEGIYSVNGTNALQVFDAKKNELTTMSGMLERFGFDDDDDRDEHKATDSNTSRLVRGSATVNKSGGDGGGGGGGGESKGDTNGNDDLLDLMDSL
jgi:hypothetical protein